MNQSKAGAIPVRHPEDVLEAERIGSGFLNRASAGSTPAEDTLTRRETMSTKRDSQFANHRLLRYATGSRAGCLPAERGSIPLRGADTGCRVMATDEPPKLGREGSIPSQPAN